MQSDRFLSDNELDRFMDAVRSPHQHQRPARDAAFFALLAHTGIRASEALALVKEDVHVFARPPWLRVARMTKGKPDGRRVDELELTDILAVVLRRHVDNVAAGARVFRMTPRQAQRLFHYYARKAGIERRNVRLYILRRTAAVRIYRATRDIATVKALLGQHVPYAALGATA